MSLIKILILSLVLALNSFAQDCKQVYHDKGVKRENLNAVLMIGVGVSVATAASGGIIMLAGPAVIGGAAVSAGTQAGVYGLYAVAIGSLALPTINIHNKFEKIEDIINAAQDNNLGNKQFKKLSKLIVKNAEKSCPRLASLTEDELNAELQNFIINANTSEELCPLVDEKAQQKRALFSRKSLAKYFVNTQC